MLVHTDFGHDPDDAIALAYLIEHDVIPDVVSLVPGWGEQVAVLSGFLECYGITPSIMTSKEVVDSEKYKAGKHSVFRARKPRNSFPLTHSKLLSIRDTTALIIGPALNLGGKLHCNEMFFQGGYSPNSVKPLEKFKGLKEVQSYNPSGARKDFKKLLASDDIKCKYYIGKNVCHGFTKRELSKYWIPENKFVRDNFWKKLKPEKAMHDVLAAMLMLNKTFGLWERAKPVFNGLKMTTEPTEELIYSLIGLSDAK